MFKKDAFFIDNTFLLETTQYVISFRITSTIMPNILTNSYIDPHVVTIIKFNHS